MPAKQDAKLRDIGRGVFDIEIDEHGDIKTADGFDTPMIVSLFSDARAFESEVQDPAKRRGWIGDEATGDNTGSKIWLFDQARLTRTVANRVEDAARECVRWLVADGHAISIRRAELVISQEAVRFVVEILTEIGAEKRSFILWEASATNGEFDPAEAVEDISPPPPFVPPPILMGVTQSLDFDGSTESMLSVAAPFGVSSKWTCAMWVKINSIPGVDSSVVDITEPGAQARNRITLAILSASGKWLVQTRGPDNAFSVIFRTQIDSPTISVGSWTHFALTFDSQTLEKHVYINGVEATAVTELQPIAGQVMTDTPDRVIRIGRSLGTPAYVAMRAHSVAVWNDVLAPAEVLAIAGEPDVDLRTSTPVPYGKAPNLRHWYIFGETPTDPGIQEDYGSPTDIDLTADASLTAADLVADVPT